MKFLFLLPALLYLALLILNIGIFSANYEVNFFWIARFEISVILFVTIFFILYIALLWVWFQFFWIFKDAEVRKLNSENTKLKEKLLSGQWELISEIEDRIQDSLHVLQWQNDTKIEHYKKENEKVISNIIFEIKNLSEKIERLKK